VGSIQWHGAPHATLLVTWMHLWQTDDVPGAAQPATSAGGSRTLQKGTHCICFVICCRVHMCSCCWSSVCRNVADERLRYIRHHVAQPCGISAQRGRSLCCPSFGGLLMLLLQSAELRRFWQVASYDRASVDAHGACACLAASAHHWHMGTLSTYAAHVQCTASARACTVSWHVADSYVHICFHVRLLAALRGNA
jgi:hypothetical protein